MLLVSTFLDRCMVGSWTMASFFIVTIMLASALHLQHLLLAFQAIPLHYVSVLKIPRKNKPPETLIHRCRLVSNVLLLSNNSLHIGFDLGFYCGLDWWKFSCNGNRMWVYR